MVTYHNLGSDSPVLGVRKSGLSGILSKFEIQLKSFKNLFKPEQTQSKNISSVSDLQCGFCKRFREKNATGSTHWKDASFKRHRDRVNCRLDCETNELHVFRFDSFLNFRCF